MKLVGIVGGVGPEATNKFCELLIKKKTKLRDQDNIPFIHYCNPVIPDRTDFILGKGEDPVPEIVKTCQALEVLGADAIVIPCNTAHAFLYRIQKQVSIPIINIVRHLVEQMRREQPNLKKVGVLATTGSIVSGIFQYYLSQYGFESVVPSASDQKELVMESIYGRGGIKAGKKQYPRKLLNKAVAGLVERGADAIILGCTELPLAIKKADHIVPFYESMDVISDKIVEYIEGTEEIPEDNAVEIEVTIKPIDVVQEVEC